MAIIWKLLEADNTTTAISVDDAGNLIVAGTIVTGGGTTDGGGNISFPANVAVTGTLGVTGVSTTGAISATSIAASTTLSVTGVATFTATDIHTSGITIGSAQSVAGAATGVNGFVISNPKNAAAGTLSGTALNVEISIGGTPYYFAVYPTKT